MATPKKTAKPKTATKTAKPKTATKTATQSTDPVESLDAANDQKAPDAPALTLAKHAEDLAGNVRPLLEPLAKAKVSAADGERLDTLAALLRVTETAWQTARKEVATGTVAKCRGPLLAGRNDLFGGIDAFVDDDAAADELADIGSVDDDDDLESDTSRLIALARKHAADLEGTEITPEKVNGTEAALDAFRRARKGAVRVDVVDDDEKGAETKHALTEAARVALGRRNRVFWALSALDRKVCKRGRFRFRADASRRGAFASYTAESGRVKKPSGGTK